MRGTLVDPPCPDWDGEDAVWCRECEAQTMHDIERWGRILWQKCQLCGTEDEDDGD